MPTTTKKARGSTTTGPPKGKGNRQTRSTPKATLSWNAIKPGDLDTFDKVIEDRVGYKPQNFQLRGTKAQLLRKDALVHAGTGRGKTVIAAAPHYHPAAAGRLTLMVSPLVALQNEQVKTFENEFKLKAIAVNSSHGGCTSEVMEALKKGEYQILLISPELLLSTKFMDSMMRDKAFTSRILSVIVDEAHVVSHWGAGFRKKYGELGMIRAFLPSETPWVAMSATLGTRVLRDVLSKLEFGKKGSYDFINEGNDRPNVALIARAMQHPANTYNDLRFVIPDNVEKGEDIPLTMIYADNLPRATDMVDYLNSLLPESLRSQGLVRPFNAVLTHDYRGVAMDVFKGGRVRVLVCTDAAGMGCNIPAVDVVVQWRLPASLSSFVQRAGRAARSFGREGLAVLLVDKGTYSLEDGESKGSKKKKKLTRKQITAIQVTNGVKRGSYGANGDAIIGGRQERVPNPEDADEGLLAFALTKRCRRLVIAKVYGNELPESRSRCCDLCHPQLLNLTRPGPPMKKAQAGVAIVKFKDPIMAVVIALKQWRRKVHERDFTNAMFGPSGILSNETIRTLALVQSIDEPEVLATVLQPMWLLYSEYKDEIIEILQDIPEDDLVPTPPPPSLQGQASTSQKRKAPTDGQDDGGREQEARPAPALSSEVTSPRPTLSALCAVNVGLRPPPTSTASPQAAAAIELRGAVDSRTNTFPQQPSASQNHLPRTQQQQQITPALYPQHQHLYSGYYYSYGAYYGPAYGYAPHPPSTGHHHPTPSQHPPHPFYPYQQHTTTTTPEDRYSSNGAALAPAHGQPVTEPAPPTRPPPLPYYPQHTYHTPGATSTTGASHDNGSNNMYYNNRT